MKALRTKTCAMCRNPKPVECFGRASHFSDGLKTMCRDCTRGYFRDWKARRVAAHSRWLDERGLEARGPGVRAGLPPVVAAGRMREGGQQ